MPVQYQTYRPKIKKQKVPQRKSAAFVFILVFAAISFGVLMIFNNTRQTKAASVSDTSATNVKPATTTAKAAPVAATPTTDDALKSAWSAIAQTNPGDIDIAVYNNKTGVVTRYDDASGTMNTASIVKLSIAEEVMIQAQKTGTSLTSTQMTNMQNMIEYSDNASASTLWNAVGSDAAMNNFFGTIGATSTVAAGGGLWGLTQTTSTDQLKVLNTLAYPSHAFLNGSSVALIDGLLDNVDADQAWGVSTGVPSSDTVELKNGWLEDSETSDAYANTPSWIVNSIGHVYGLGVDYTIAVLTDGQTTEQSGIYAVDDLSQATWNTLSQ